MQSFEKINEIQKQEHNIFNFYINNITTTQYIEEILGMPKLPVIGHYNNNEYNFGNILSLITLDIDICQGEKNDKIISKYTDFKLPKNIQEYLNIYEEIEIDNNTKNKKEHVYFYPKKKLNFYFIISDLPQFIVNRKNPNEPLKYLICNIVPHLFYNKNNVVDFSNSKRIVFEKGISLFEVENCGKDIDYEIKNGIDINNLRLEYSSIHLKKGSLAFSPNNLRFKLDIQKNLSQFYLIINNEEDDFHSVFYYITCNNEKSKEKMKEAFVLSMNIKELVNNIKLYFPDSKDVNDHLDKLFEN